jgi:hypothetical protein
MTDSGDWEQSAEFRAMIVIHAFIKVEEDRNGETDDRNAVCVMNNG